MPLHRRAPERLRQGRGPHIAAPGGPTDALGEPGQGAQGLRPGTSRQGPRRLRGALYQLPAQRGPDSPAPGGEWPQKGACGEATQDRKGLIQTFLDE